MSAHEFAALTGPELGELAADPGTIGLIPLGAAEQHGPHLPVSTDALIAARLARQIGEALDVPVLALPVPPIGISDHHARFAGTLTVGPDVLEGIVLAYLDGLRRIGVRRAAMFSAHGGNFAFMDEVANRHAERDGVRLVAYADFLRYVEVMVEGARKTGLEPPASDVHAGALETEPGTRRVPSTGTRLRRRRGLHGRGGRLAGAADRRGNACA